ncbi:MAG: tryptophan-rich sensory protein, partial [Candidatus Bathyarchaeota archaeon]|nr:tryptophan-rich sensory protein [Candidatus Bathyarchaeota archaeon]
WDGGGIDHLTWAVLVIVVALLITLTVIATRKDAAYGLVIVWALAGIMVKQIENQTIVLTTQVSITIALVAIVAMVVVSKLKR